jgi:S-DNA-T family DNA segregation ATPase FtsK/SpoIIIE
MPAPAALPEAPPSDLARRRDEFLGILICAAGLLLTAALVSYHPGDPSLFSSVADPTVRPANWAGRIGASYAEFSLQFFGLASLAVPLTLFAVALRRFFSRPVGAWGTKSLGVLLLLLTAAPLAQLAFGRPAFLGGGLGAGGYVGEVISAGLVSALNPPGASILLGAAFLIAVLLATSLSLGAVARGAGLRMSGWWRVRTLERERKKEAELKEKQRREVVKKHLARAKEDAERPPQPEEEADQPVADVVYIPSIATLRVREKSGTGKFSIQRTRGDSGERPSVVDRAAGAPGRPAAGAADAASASGVLERLGEVSALRPAAPRAPSKDVSAADAPRPIARPAQIPAAAPVAQRVLPFPSMKESGGWLFPPEKLLRPAPKRDRDRDREELRDTMELIRAKCLEFGVEGAVDAYTPGPVVTTFEFKPSAGVKVSKVASLENDLALALAAEKVRIERIPGRSAVGIEVPNKNRELIALRDVIESESFRRSPSLLTIALGIDVQGEPVVADLARMPHLLVAGQTGAGKSVGVNGMITSILYKARPDEVKFIFVDPKMNDMKDYEDLPHLLVPVIVDPKKAANALRWAVEEMEGRYKHLSQWPGVRNIEQYNAAIKDPRSLAEVKEKLGDALKIPEGGAIPPMPYIVIVIDELADLMMTAPREIEESVARLAQKARAVGIHLILATQRPSVDVITGTIKANLPCRVAFTTRTKIDSRTILDSMGAEALLGQGDMLFLPPGTSYLRRVHGGFISGEETKEICRFLKKQGKPNYDDAVTADRDGGADSAGSRASADDADPMYDQAARLVVRERMASISFLQRRLEIGFSRAGKLIDMMQRDGIVGPPTGGSKSREVLVPIDYFEEVDRQPR